MTCAPQLKLPLNLSPQRTLWRLDSLKEVLDKHEDDLLALVEHGKLEWCFDLSRENAKRKFIHVWRQSVLEFANEITAPERTWEEVVAAILPGKESVKASELRNWWSDNQGHIANLITDKTLLVDRRRAAPGRGRHSSPFLLRSSVVSFLEARRL